MKLYQHIPLGYALTIVSDGVTSGLYVQTQPGSDYTPSSFAADSTTVVGPFNDARNYEISYSGNAPALSCVQSGQYTKADDDVTVKTSNDITALTPLNETNVAEIANDADGTAIATAVNGILDILIAAGLMAAPE